MFYALLLALPIVYYIYSRLSSLRRNLRDAKSSGLPYVISPVYGYDRKWLALEPLLTPFIRRLPKFLLEPWIKVVGGDWSWEFRFAPFAEHGSTFIVVSPTRNILMTAEPDVITQITSRRSDFPKPVALYDLLEIYGKNLLTVEGKEWRRHRRITAPPFTENNNRLVWKESIFQAGQMVESWKEAATKEANGHANGNANGHTVSTEKEESKSVGAIVEGLATDSMRMTLHIISRAGFDVRCLWPGVSAARKDDDGAIKSGEVPPGYQMSYVDALQTLLHLIVIPLLIPGWVCRWSPFAVLRTARKAYIDWGKYMADMYDRKMAKITSSKSSTDDAGLDLMGAMIRGSANDSSGGGLTKQEVMGDSFLLFIAGHETTANSIHFTILYLAIHPEIQRKLQAELDTIFGDRIKDPTTWDYDADLPRLFAGIAGAIMNEELRLVPPVIVIPKSTLPHSPQKLDVHGKEVVVPADTYIALNAGAVHRNPAFWPIGPPRSDDEGGRIHPLSNVDNDLEEFKPERWFLDSDAQNTGPHSAEEAKSKEELEFGVNAASDTASTMFRPKRGAYIPFSDGFRACLGRRFAQVEILAMLTVIFGTHSVELDTSEYASYDEVMGMGESERRGIWRKAKMEAERKMREDMGTIITLQFRSTGVKVRVCERGSELFG